MLVETQFTDIDDPTRFGPVGVHTERVLHFGQRGRPCVACILRAQEAPTRNGPQVWLRRSASVIVGSSIPEKPLHRVHSWESLDRAHSWESLYRVHSWESPETIVVVGLLLLLALARAASLRPTRFYFWQRQRQTLSVGCLSSGHSQARKLLLFRLRSLHNVSAGNDPSVVPFHSPSSLKSRGKPLMRYPRDCPFRRRRWSLMTAWGR
jgi:hypothetical protein